ncbi:secretin N-terminal domain-containing protein [Dechloromonas sp. HYN0024]|uniref:secretin N-terminal domain-containing protein n=1 Tax=Dechloromonas sp. HYN0024 TaxID=2231055 RepID=UPI000E4304A8|nr:secretin N-terminal domain-containing protein [Dechloromonas sp. HYN0024]AXS81040.1 general secretion pathway protein GspD [Dechloromonas sp. HYN0024]
MHLRPKTGVRSAVTLITLCIATLFAGCASDLHHYQGISLTDEGHYEEGLAKLDLARQEAPKDVKKQQAYIQQRDLVIKKLLALASSARAVEDYEKAESQYLRVLNLDSNNMAARQGLAAIEAEQRHARMFAEAQAAFKRGDMVSAQATVRALLVENPGHVKGNQLRYQIGESTLKEDIAGPTLNIKGRKPVSLQFRETNLKMVFEAISRATGVNILVDKDVRNDLKVTLFIRDTPVDETLDLVLMQNQLEKRVLGENTVLIYPQTAAKMKDYQELKVRRFSLTNADPKHVQSMIKAILKTKDVFLDEKTNAVIIRDSAQAIRLAERLVASMDQPEPEVLLEVELMDVNRNKTIDLGVNWPTSISWAFAKVPVVQTDGSTKANSGPITINDWRGRTGQNITLNVGNGFGVAVKALQNDGDTRVLATPRIRVRNHEKAKTMVGSRTPVISSAATTTQGAASSVYNTNIQYLETGIKLEVEPTIYLDGDVAIKISVEVSDLGDKYENATTGTLAYSTTTNNASTVLRLKDGETQLLAGLLRGMTANNGSGKIPGLGDIPIAGRLFGIQSDQWQNREIVLAITPRIIRNNQIAEGDLIEMWSGTESALRYGNTKIRIPANSGIVSPTAVPTLAPPPAPAPVAPVPAAMPVAPQPAPATTVVPAEMPPAVPPPAAAAEAPAPTLVTISRPGFSPTVRLVTPQVPLVPPSETPAAAATNAPAQ